MLKLADNLKLPLDVVTQTIAILAKRRAGKSYTMRRLAEQLVKASQQVVIVDPKGDQWGIRSSADGKGPGLPLVIIGGERGDVPLETGAGEIVAKLVVEERVSAVLDLSLLRKKEVSTFMTDFLENLYRLKARELYRTPMMLVVDEADAIAPQKPMPGEERMLGAIEDIVRRGGQRGIGCVVVTQRSAVLNKNVLTQAQILVALRTIAPQDLKAMKEWIDVHGEEAERKVLMESLPSLPTGDAWFWSPGWPTEGGIFKRVHVDPIETFDSGATPKPGEKRREPKTVADVDLEALKRQMAATIEKAKADDPRELRKKITELEKQLKAKPAAAPAAAGKEKRVEVPVVKDGQLQRIEKILDRLQVLQASHIDKLGEVYNPMTAILVDIRRAIGQTVTAKQAPQTAPVLRHTPTRSPGSGGRPVERPHRPAPRAMTPAADTGDLTGPERKILAALAELHALGLHPADKQQLGLMAGYTNVRSGGFSEPLGRLVAGGYVTSPTTGKIAITDIGLKAAGEVYPPADSEELQARIMDRLSGPEQRLLRELIAVHPERLTKEDLGGRCGYTNIRSGGFSEPLGRLHTLGLVDTPERGVVVASDALFI